MKCPWTHKWISAVNLTLLILVLLIACAFLAGLPMALWGMIR